MSVKTNYIDIFSLTISAIFIVILLIVPFYYYQYGDDFVFLLAIQEHGVFGAILDKYMNWDGRHLSPSGLVQMLSFKYLSGEASVLLGISALFLVVFIGLKTILRKIQFPYSLTLFAVFSIGILPFYKDVLVWQTGIIYLFFTIQLFLVFFIYFSKKVKNSYLELLLVLILSLNTQNFGLPQILFFGLIIFYNYTNGISVKREWLLLIMSILGLLIVSLAPGNFGRLNSVSTPNYSIINILQLFIGKVLKALNYSKYIFFGGLIAGLTVDFDFLIIKEKQKLILLAFLFFSMCFGFYDSFHFRTRVGKSQSYL